VIVIVTIVIVIEIETVIVIETVIEIVIKIVIEIVIEIVVIVVVIVVVTVVVIDGNHENGIGVENGNVVAALVLEVLLQAAYVVIGLKAIVKWPKAAIFPMLDQVELETKRVYLANIGPPRKVVAWEIAVNSCMMDLRVLSEKRTNVNVRIERVVIVTVRITDLKMGCHLSPHGEGSRRERRDKDKESPAQSSEARDRSAPSS